jgi:hypothetical protein
MNAPVPLELNVAIAQKYTGTRTASRGRLTAMLKQSA